MADRHSVLEGAWGLFCLLWLLAVSGCHGPGQKVGPPPQEAVARVVPVTEASERPPGEPVGLGCKPAAAPSSAGREREMAEAEAGLKAALARWGGDSVQTVPALERLAELHRRGGDLEAAQALYRQAIEVVEDAGTPYLRDLATLLGHSGGVYRQAGRYREAEEALRHGLALREKVLSADDRALAVAWANLGALLLDQARFPEAESALGAAHRAVGGGVAGDPLGSTIFGSFAALYRATGDYRRSELFFQQALSARTDRDTRMRLLNGLASLNLLLHDHKAAEASLREALALAHDPAPASDTLAETYNNMAVLHQRQGRFAAAEVCQYAALELLRGRYGPDHPRVLAVLHNLGMLRYRRGDLERAEAVLREVVARSDGLSPASADSLNALAGVVWARGDSEQTHRLLSDALDLRLRRLPGDHPDLASAYNNLAVYLAGVGRYGDSLEAFSRGSDMDGKLLEHVLGFASEERKIKYLGEKNRHLHALFSLVTSRLRDDRDAIRLAADTWLRRKGMILEVQRRYRESLVYRDAPEAVALLQRLGRLRGELSRLIYADEAHRQGEISALERQVEALEGELVRLSPSYAQERGLERADVSAIVERLPPDAILVEIARFDRFAFSEHDPRRRWRAAEYVAFLISPAFEDGVEMIGLGPAAVIEQSVGHVRRWLRSITPNDRALALHLRQLHQRVFLPLQRRFPSGTKNVFLAPDGALNLVPFEILSEDGHHFLTDDFDFSYLATGRDLLRKGSRVRPGAAALLLGDPDFDLDSGRKATTTRPGPGGSPVDLGKGDRAARFSAHEKQTFRRLPGTLGEVRAIRRVLQPMPVDYFVQGAATEERLDDLARPRLIHLATHGFFLPWLALPADSSPRSGETTDWIRIGNPLLRSGLALAGANHPGGPADARHDGILTAEDVLGLDLRGTELVVLSACETGLGRVINGEGVYGLRRAFAAAGAGGLIMSLWKVPDEETRELMSVFYRQWARNGSTPAQALRHARHRLRQTLQRRGGADSPYYWGGFIYQGGPGSGMEQVPQGGPL